MEHGGWIDLHEFSTKYGVSLSTLRRRIRGKSIRFKLEKGRYWLPDSIEVMSVAPLFSRGHDTTSNPAAAPNQSIRSLLPAESQLRLNELEGENRRLKAQIAELNTLVGVLEAELSAKDALATQTNFTEFNA